MAATTAKINRSRSFRRNLTPFLYLLPAFVIMGIITFYPLIYQVIISFTDFSTKDLLLQLKSPKLNYIGLQNYIDIFTGGLPVQNFDFFRVLTYNFWWAISNVALHLPAGVLIAVLLNIKGIWFKRIYRAIFVLPVVFPPLVVATIWRNIFDEQYGAMNQALTTLISLFGVTDPVRLRWLFEYQAPIPWLLPNGPLPLAYYAMMIANFWLGWPFMCLVATGALQSIPKELYEAASIDGASKVYEFWNITVPLLRPAMVPAAIYGFTMSFNLFNFVYFMTGGGPARSTEILVTFAYDLVRNLRLYGAAGAFSVIIFFVVLVTFLITNKLTRATESYASHKMATQVGSLPKKNFLVRFFTMNTSGSRDSGERLPLWRQLLLQFLCILITIEVMFPIMYVITMSLSPNPTRPSSLALFPREVSFDAYAQVLARPTANPITFLELFRNSFVLSVGVGLVALLVSVTAAYAFSRFKFKARQILMIMVFIPLLMPGVGLTTPLFLLLNNFRIVDCGSGVVAVFPFMSCDPGVTGKMIVNLRDSLLGVGIAMVSGALPFAIWNLKGYLDTIPKDLEEAAAIDGCDSNQTFFLIVLPLAVPQLVVTFFLGFIGHWQEFALPWLFLTKPESYTLSMTLYNMTGQYASSIPWNRFAAMAVIVALPVAFIYILLQKQIVSGLTAGGVKG